jgi:hypothetical protein
VTDLTGAGGLSAVADRDDNGDGIDETLRNAYVMPPANPPKTLPFGPFELIHFDCPVGTEVRAHDLHCSISDASDPLGNTIMDPTNLPLCLVGVASHGGTPNVKCPVPNEGGN